MVRIVPITSFRRNAGSYLDQLAETGPVTIIRDGKIVGRLVPPTKTQPKVDTQERISKIKNLAGGLKLTRQKSPAQINQEYDLLYEKMLP